MTEHLAPDTRKVPRVPSVFCATPSAVKAGAELAPLVILRAPRGFGKRSTVAFWLRSERYATTPVAWINIQRRTSRRDFWNAVRVALQNAGIPTADSTSHRTSVETALLHYTEPLVVVIEGLHFVTDTVVDNELVNLVQRNATVHLVITTRVDRPISGIGRATVDATVLDVADLALGAAETTQLSQALGLEMSPDEAEIIVRQYAGWPALIRGELVDSYRASDGTIRTEGVTATRYASVVLADTDHDEYRMIAMALAVPDVLRAEDVAVLIDNAQARASARSVMNSWFLQSDDSHPSIPSGIRTLLLEVLRSDHPDLYRVFNSRIAHRRLASGEHLEALVHAGRGEAWDIAVQILEGAWADLLAHHRCDLVAIAHHIPPEWISKSVSLAVLHDYLLADDITNQAEEALRSGRLRPGATLTLRPMTRTQRLALRFEDTPTWPAPERSQVWPLSNIGASAVDSLPLVLRSEVPEQLMQWALSMLYNNDPVSSAYGFTLAYLDAIEVGNSSAAREAANAAALSLALLGHLELSDAWLTRAGDIEAPTSPLEEVSSDFTRSILATQRLVGDIVVPHRAAVNHPGLATLVEFTQIGTAFFETLLGDPVRARGQSKRLNNECLADMDTLLAQSVDALRIDLALAEGDIDAASSPVGAPNSGLWGQTARARYAFYIGGYDEALRLTEASAQLAGTRPRASLELLLVHACAAWRSGKKETAVDALASAVSIASDTGVLLPFLTVPREDLEAIAPPGSWSRQFLDQKPLAGTDTVFPAPLEAGELSDAELRVLAALQSSTPVTHLGRRLYLAESTVKTHVRHIYRKLGVSNRDDALARAQALNLLP